MATSESEEKRVFTILWRIENFRHFECTKLNNIGSPMFRARTLEETEFVMVLSPKGESGNDKHLSIHLYQYDGSLDFRIDCEWSFIGYDGSPLVSDSTRNLDMDDDPPFTMSVCATYEEVFVSKRSTFFSHDTLTVRLRIWKSDGDLSNNEFISCRTRLDAVDYSFLWPLKGFSGLQLKEKVTTLVKFCNNFGSDDLILQFSFEGESLEDASVNVKLTSDSNCNILSLTLQVSVLNNELKVISSTEIKSEDFEKDDGKYYTITKLVSRKEVMRKKSDCLRNDILTLGCELFFVCYTDFIDKYYQGDSNQEVLCRTKDVSMLLVKSCQKDPLIVLGENFLSLYKEQNFTDFKLFSGDVSIPVHKSILSARSPVFKAMFLSGRKESDSDSQDVPDLDIHTLNRMLTFLYGGTVEPNLQMQSTAKLYYAAHKYQVESLKQQCSTIMRAGIMVSNVSDILTLADRHQDKELMSFAHEFFLHNFDEVIQSEEWESFQNSDTGLAGNTLFQVCKKRIDRERPLTHENLRSKRPKQRSFHLVK